MTVVGGKWKANTDIQAIEPAIFDSDSTYQFLNSLISELIVSTKQGRGVDCQQRLVLFYDGPDSWG